MDVDAPGSGGVKYNTPQHLEPESATSVRINQSVYVLVPKVPEEAVEQAAKHMHVTSVPAQTRELLNDKDVPTLTAVNPAFSKDRYWLRPLCGCIDAQCAAVAFRQDRHPQNTLRGCVLRSTRRSSVSNRRMQPVRRLP